MTITNAVTAHPIMEDNVHANVTQVPSTSPSKTVTQTVTYHSREPSIITYIHPICIIRRLTTGSWKRKTKVVSTTVTEAVPAM